jgi:hypothetical protein
MICPYEVNYSIMLGALKALPSFPMEVQVCVCVSSKILLPVYGNEHLF